MINVPKLKFFKSWVSLSVKNLLTAVPGKGKYSQTSSSEFPIKLSPAYWVPEGKFFGPKGEKKKVHANFAEGIVDLNMVIKPSLNVIDGIASYYGAVPLKKEEKPIELNTILASRDPLALDFVASKIGGLNPLNIPYLKRAAERGLGESDYNQIQVVGTPLHKIEKAWKIGLAKIQANTD